MRTHICRMQLYMNRALLWAASNIPYMYTHAIHVFTMNLYMYMYVHVCAIKLSSPSLSFSPQMVAEPSPFINQSRATATPTHAKKSFTGKLKSSLPAGHSRSKSLMKRIRAQMQEVELISERNSKHLFIEKCQSLPGYDCTFFSVRVPSAARFRKGAHTKQIGRAHV